MVRMVHTNNFYEMGLEISDPKKELWTKTVFWEGWGISNLISQFKMLDLEFPCDIGGSGCHGSIRLVKSV